MENFDLSAASVFGNSDLGTKTLQCEDHGDYESVGFLFKDREIWGGCPVCLDRKSREEFIRDNEQRERDRRDYILRQSFGRACIPKRFQGKTFDSYFADSEQKQRALSVCKEYAKTLGSDDHESPSLILCGRPGTGKTHLACAIADQLIRGGRSAVFARVFDAVRTIKSTWGRESEVTETQAIRSFIEPDLLILDEVGVQFGSEAEMLMVFEIINGRYEAIKPTILISNLPITELKNFIGERVMDRLREGGGKYIAFDWDSFRAQA